MRVQALAEHITQLIREDNHPEIMNAETRGKDGHVLALVEFANGATATVQALRVTGPGISGPDYTVPDKAW